MTDIVQSYVHVFKQCTLKDATSHDCSRFRSTTLSSKYYQYYYDCLAHITNAFKAFNVLHHFNQTPQVSSIIIPLEYLSYSMTRVLSSSGVFSAATGGGKPSKDCSLLCSVAEIFDFYIVCLDFNR